MNINNIFTKFITIILAIFVLAASFTMTASATENSPTYEIELSVNGKTEVRANPGDVLTMTMTLRRTDENESYRMYAMQDEIRYDPTFFEVLSENAFAIDGIEMTDIGLIDDYHAFYVNYVSMSGGQEWDAETVIGNFQIKVVGEHGSSKMKNENFIISMKDGSGSYDIKVNDLLVIVSTECTVKFDSMGGSEIKEQLVQFGELIQKPEDPVRDGYSFTGWYKDIYLNEQWDFGKDTVTDNMVLYAGWQAGNLETENQSFEFPWWILMVILYVIVVIYLIIRIYKKKNRNK